MERTRQILRKAGARLRSVIRDNQYSSERMRRLAEEAVTPYTASQRRGEEVLRVDRKFRTHGPEDQRKEYCKRLAVESAYSFLKTQYSMAVNKVRGLRNVAVLSPLQHPQPGAEQGGCRKHGKAGEDGLTHLL